MNSSYPNATFNGFTKRLRPKGAIEVLPEYAGFYFRSPRFRVVVSNMASITTRASLNNEMLAALSIVVPSLPEQRAIAEVLSSLDDKIDLLHRQNKTLEAMAETLFRPWFIEEARESWGKGKLKDIASFHNGKSRPKEIAAGKIPIYGGNGVLGYTDQSNHEGESIIIGRVGAYCGSLYFENKAIWITDNALLAKPAKKNYLYYLFYQLKSFNLNTMAEGSSHPLLTQTLLNSIKINIPPENKMILFDSHIKEWFDKIDFNRSQIHTLTKLRDELLPKLMSGEEVRVKL